MKPAALTTILSVVLFSLSLTGCKPKPPAPVVHTDTIFVDPTQPGATKFTPTSAPAADTRPLIICFGDSLTAGYGTDLGQSYPDNLQRLLDAEGYHYHVVNSGISGNTTKDGLDRIARVLARLAGHPGSVVVVEFGGNDGLRGLPIEQTQANLSAILAQLQASNITIALAGITLPPSYGPDYIKKFDAMYPALAKRYHVPFIPFLLKDVYGVPGDMQADDTHATAQGNQQVARNVEALLKPLLKK